MGPMTVPVAALELVQASVLVRAQGLASAKQVGQPVKWLLMAEPSVMLESLAGQLLSYQQLDHYHYHHHHRLT